MKVRHIASVGILAGVVFTGGWVFYAAGHLLPIPGGKFVAMTPYLAFAMALIADRVRSPWTTSMVGVAMGAVAALFTPLMSLAIVSSAVAADVTGRLLPARIPIHARRALTAAAFPFWGFWAFTGVSIFLTRNPMYDMIRPVHLFLMALFVGIISAAGGYFGTGLSGRLRALNGER